MSESKPHSVLDERWEIVQRNLGGLGLAHYDQSTRALHSLKLEVAELLEHLQAVQEDHEATTERLRERRDEHARLVEQLEALEVALSDPLCDRWTVARIREVLNPANRPGWATGEAVVSECVFCESRNVWEIGNAAWRCADCGKGGPGVAVRLPASRPT